MAYRIGIDGYNLALTHGTGIATYGFVLAKTLQGLGNRIDGLFGIDVGDDPATREVMFYDKLGSEATRAKTYAEVKRERSVVRRTALLPFLARRAIDIPLTDKVEKQAFAQRLPAFDRLFSIPYLFEAAHRYFNRYGRLMPVAMREPPDIMHWTYPVPVTLQGARNIYTLHDLIPLKLPYTTLDGKQSYRRLVGACIDGADAVATVSETSANDIGAEFPAAARKVVNTFQASPMPGGEDALSFEDEGAMIRGIFGLAPRGYFLFYGALEPKKNLGRLLEAYLGLDTETPLVLVGSRSWQAEGELQLLSSLSEDGQRRIIRLDYLPRTLLRRLIRCARAVMFPSLYEGFGLPLLEAMELGTPVLTSAIGSICEVVGDAAALVDPYDPSSMAAALRRLDSDAAFRAHLSTAGLTQAKIFSVDRYAPRLDALYRLATS